MIECTKIGSSGLITLHTISPFTRGQIAWHWNTHYDHQITQETNSWFSGQPVGLPLMASLTNLGRSHAFPLSSTQWLERLHSRLFHNLKFRSVPHSFCFGWLNLHTQIHKEEGRNESQQCTWNEWIKSELIKFECLYTRPRVLFICSYTLTASWNTCLAHTFFKIEKNRDKPNSSEACL